MEKINELKSKVRKAGNFGMDNALAILEALNSLDKSLNKIIRKNPKIEIKEGRYKGLLERIIRQNKLIIDLIKLDHFDVDKEERERLRDEIA